MTLKYEPRYLPFFAITLSKYSPLEQARIEKKIMSALNDPKHFSYGMEGLLRGKREIKVGGDIRVLIVWCEDCLQNGLNQYNDCNKCNEDMESVIKCLMVGSHKDIERLQKSRQKVHQLLEVE